MQILKCMNFHVKIMIVDKSAYFSIKVMFNFNNGVDAGIDFDIFEQEMIHL